jgi:hypothetical protein
MIPPQSVPSQRKLDPIILLTVVILLLTIGLALFGYYKWKSKPEDQSEPVVGPSNYPVPSVADASLALNIEDPSQWIEYDKLGYTLLLPSRFELPPYWELSQMQRQFLLNGAGIEPIFIARDSEFLLTTIDIFVSDYAGNPDPGHFLAGTAANDGIIDRSAYTLGEWRVGRVIYPSNEIPSMGSIVYSFVIYDQMWWIQASLPLSELNQWVPILDMIVQNLKVEEPYPVH